MKTKPQNRALAPFKYSAIAMSLSLSALLLTGCGAEKETTDISIPVVKPALTEVIQEQMSDNLSFNGVVRAAQRADLAFRISGRVNHIFVKEGDFVKEGQLLAKLDSRDAQTAFDAAQLELKDARTEYQRGKTIFEKSQAISKSDLDKLKTRFNLAQNHLIEARNQLDYTQLVAPFDGIIGRKMVENHAQVQANNPIISLQNLNDLEVVVNIPDNVMLSGLRSTKGQAEINSIPGQTFPVSLRTFATQADPITQTYPVVLGFSDLKGFRVLPGMSVKVSPVEVTSSVPVEKIITIPLTAVVPDNQGKQFVWVIDKNNKTTKRYIKVGALSKNRIQVIGCLKPGEVIVIAGVSSIRSGMEVRPYTDKTSGA